MDLRNIPLSALCDLHEYLSDAHGDLHQAWTIVSRATGQHSNSLSQAADYVANAARAVSDRIQALTDAEAVLR